MPPFTASVSVAFEGAEKPRTRAEIFLRPAAIAGSQGMGHALADRTGNFQIKDVYPGTYKVVAVSPGAPYFLSSIKLADREVLGQFLEFQNGTVPLHVVFESKGGGVRGVVEDCGNATVILAPADRSLREAQFVQTAKCGDGGRFEIANMRPGDYSAFALNRWEGPLDLLSNLDRGLANQGVSVRVNRGETATVELRITSQEP
jgi:hypothetical protein